ncbi:hypothetical protein [Brevibacterium litoralis]|uniref:hypothetical protein n=1 Tax=Brevibacterium litoralis TaxID=3138935 RepID=UPI0032EEC3D5
MDHVHPDDSSPEDALFPVFDVALPVDGDGGPAETAADTAAPVASSGTHPREPAPEPEVSLFDEPVAPEAPASAEPTPEAPDAEAPSPAEPTAEESSGEAPVPEAPIPEEPSADATADTAPRLYSEDDGGAEDDEPVLPGMEGLAPVRPSLEFRLQNAVVNAGPKPGDEARQADKKNWNERLSAELALAISDDLRERGMPEVMPRRDESGLNMGAERRLAGGIGAKKVDVTWATEESGLIYAVSVKTIMFRDGKSQNYQKNLTNRRGDMLNEAVTLHRRFPYAVLGAFLFLDVGAARDHTARRKSTFDNVFPRFRLFTRRQDPSGREEQYERFFVILVDSEVSPPALTAYEVNDRGTPIDLDEAVDDVLELIGERNFDLYDGTEGTITRLG